MLSNTLNFSTNSKLFPVYKLKRCNSSKKHIFSILSECQPSCTLAYASVQHLSLPSATQYWHDLIASVAKDFRDSQLGFSVADEELFANDLKAMGLEDWGEDVAVGIYAPGESK